MRADPRIPLWNRAAIFRSASTFRRRRSQPSRNARVPCSDRVRGSSRNLRAVLLQSMTASEVTFPFLNFHRPFFVMIDSAVFAFRPPERNHFLDNFWNRVCLGTNCASAWHTPERAHSAAHQLCFFSGQQLIL